MTENALFSHSWLSMTNFKVVCMFSAWCVCVGGGKGYYASGLTILHVALHLRVAKFFLSNALELELSVKFSLVNRTSSFPFKWLKYGK